MMNEVKFADLCDNLSHMSMTQLNDLLEMTKDAMETRKERFQYLCGELFKFLEAIDNEFPNAHLPLIVGDNNEVSILDGIVPHDFVERCRMDE